MRTRTQIQRWLLAGLLSLGSAVLADTNHHASSGGSNTTNIREEHASQPLPALRDDNTASASADTSPAWRQITDRNGIQVSVNYDANSRLKQFRGVTIMSLSDEYAMLALYNDTEAFPRWLHLISEASLIKEHSMLDKDLRFLIKMPWPVSDREVLLKATLVYVTHKDNESVTAYLNGTPDLLPLNDDYIRVPELSGLFSFERITPGKVKVTYQISLALGGYLPNWLVNLTTRDIPYFTLDKLRRLVITEHYKNHYYPELNLFGPGRPADAPTVKSWIYQSGLDQPDKTPK